MGVVQKVALSTTVLSYLGVALGYLNKGFLFIIILSVEEIGLLSLILSIGLLLAQFSNLGVTSLIWRFFPFFKNAEQRHSGFFPLMLVVSLVGITIFTLLALLFHDQIVGMYSSRSPLFGDYFYWILPIGAFYALFNVLDFYLRSLYKNIMAVVALELILRFGLTVGLLLYWKDYLAFDEFVIWHSLIYTLPFIILFIYMKVIGELNLSVSSIRVPKRFRKIMVTFASFNYANSMASTLVQSLDIIMIAQFVGLKATGVYATIVFVTSFVQVPYRSVLRVSSPLVADFTKQRNYKELEILYKKVSSILLLVGLGSFLGIWLNKDFLISLLGPEFKSGIWIFLFLMMGRLIDMYFGLNAAIFAASKKYKYDLVLTILLIGIVYSLNLLFIPIWGAIGAAISTGIAWVVYNIVRLIFVWKTVKIHPFQPKQFIVITLGILAIFLSMLLDGIFENVWINLILDNATILIVFVFPIIIFSLEEESVNLLKKQLTRLRKK